MIVTDSKASDPVRPVLLNFGGDVGEGEPFAHMVGNAVLNGALRRRASELGSQCWTAWRWILSGPKCPMWRFDSPTVHLFRPAC